MRASPAIAPSVLGGNVVELYPEARRLLETAREARTPSLEDRERVFAALMAGVAVTAVAPGAAAAKTAAAKTGLVGKLAGNALWIKAAASVAVISAASVSTIAYVRHRESKTVQPPVPVAVPVVSAPREQPAPAPEPEPSPQPVTPSAPPPVPRALPPVEHAAPASNPPLSAALARNAEGPSVELSLLRQAQAARRAGQPAHALELAREHADKYPRSRLWAERETLRVLALCDLGRVDAARRSAAQLQYLWSSPLRATLNASCVGK